MAAELVKYDIFLLLRSYCLEKKKVFLIKQNSSFSTIWWTITKQKVLFAICVFNREMYSNHHVNHKLQRSQSNYTRTRLKGGQKYHCCLPTRCVMRGCHEQVGLLCYQHDIKACFWIVYGVYRLLCSPTTGHCKLLTFQSTHLWFTAKGTARKSLMTSFTI